MTDTFTFRQRLRSYGITARYKYCIVWYCITLLAQTTRDKSLFCILANSSDRSRLHSGNKCTFSPPDSFPVEINRRFRKSALDFLLVIHYNYGCIPLIYEVIQPYWTFSFWRGFPYWSSFGGFEPLKVD